MSEPWSGFDSAYIDLIWVYVNNINHPSHHVMTLKSGDYLRVSLPSSYSPRQWGWLEEWLPSSLNSPTASCGTFSTLVKKEPSGPVALWWLFEEVVDTYARSLQEFFSYRNMLVSGDEEQ